MIENVLGRLTKVKGKNGSWTACCPAHEDNSPSLAVRVTDDGRILMHCFAGCSIDRVLDAIGVSMNDLFSQDERQAQYPGHGKPPVKPAFYASDLIRILSMEALVVLVSASDLRRGKALSEEDQQRLLVAQQRIEEVMHYANI